MRIHSSALILALPAAAFAAGSSQPPPRTGQAAAHASRLAPEVVIATWEKLIGNWVADNSKFKNDVDTMDAHDVKADGTSEMVQTFFDPGAGTTSIVGHRSKLEGDVHTTSSFNVDEKGVWTPRRTYVWRRIVKGR